MANLVQSDWDGPTGHAVQILKKQRTSGANAGKTIKEIEKYRQNDTLKIRYLYTDGTSETLVFDNNVMCYAAGAYDTAAHITG